MLQLLQIGVSCPRRLASHFLLGLVKNYGMPAFAGMALIFCFITNAHAIVPTQEAPIAVVRALDKMTARVEVLEIPVNTPISFGTLIITAHTCRSTQPEEQPESAAYLEIGEFKPGSRDIPVFHGWMFASSPALSAMEHPIYDIWLIGCKTPPAPPAPEEAKPPVPPVPAPALDTKKKQ